MLKKLSLVVPSLCALPAILSSLGVRAASKCVDQFVDAVDCEAAANVAFAATACHVTAK